VRIVTGIAAVVFKSGVLVLAGGLAHVTAAALTFTEVRHQTPSRRRVRIMAGETGRFRAGISMFSSLLAVVAGGAKIRDVTKQHFGPGAGMDFMTVGTAPGSRLMFECSVHERIMAVRTRQVLTRRVDVRVVTIGTPVIGHRCVDEPADHLVRMAVNTLIRADVLHQHAGAVG